MIKNYFKIAWRNMLKSKFYAIVNILGLSTGIAFTLLVAAYVWQELQVNSDLKNGKNQYLVQSKWKDPNMGLDITTYGNLARELKAQYPNLVANYYSWDGISSNVSVGDKVFREGLQIGDSSLLNMYGFKLLYGDVKTAFVNPNSVVITQNKAIKYFGKADVLGENITIESFSGTKQAFMITGVMDRPAKNSVISINDDNNNEFFLPIESASFFGRSIQNWTSPFIVSYIELKDGVNPASLTIPMKTLLKSNTSAQISNNLEPYLTPLHDYYLSANNGLIKKTLYTLSFTALFILAMAIINFVNLCVSRAGSRIKEIGVRKVMGGLKQQLIVQFLTESFLLVLIAMVVALILYQLALPYFSDMLGKTVPGLFAMPSYFLAAPFVLAGVLGLLAGIYPAFVLSSVKPAEAVKGKLNQIKENVLLRKTLVGFQFGTATVVFIGALIVSQQVNLFFSKDLGYNKDYIIYTNLPRNWTSEGVQKMEAIKREFAQLPQVSHAALSFEIPNGKYGNNVQLHKYGADPLQSIPTQLMVTDNDYAATYSIPMSAGTFFTPSYTPGDSAKIVLNETSCTSLGFNSPEQAINQTVKMPGSDINWTVCGVTKDFHMESMQGKIQPIVFMNVHFNTLYRVFSFKLKPGNMQQAVVALEKKWKQLLPGAAFDYGFMDDALKKMYTSEIQLKKASYTATVLAMIIVLLGVIGLISLNIQKRTKEIGIRKILGSSVQAIISLFVKDFISIVLVAALFACPLAWWMMHQWLNGYANRIHITSMPFVITIGMLVAVTALLIVIQTAKAATSNPVKSIRTE
jgi:putative ABC transport system permease protein